MVAARSLIRIMALLISAACCAALPGCGNGPSSPGPAPGGATPKTEQVVIGGESFTLELVADPATRELGLMKRTSIPEHGGMLFVFPDSELRVQRFWMGHCLVDVDIIFLDPHGVVTATHRMKMQPPQRSDESATDYDRRMPRYSSGYPAQFAIELRAGSLERLKAGVDDKLKLDVARLKAMAR